jgi:hypothetical protein
VIAGVISVASLIVAIISIVPIFTKDQSRVDSLVVTATKFRPTEVMSFAVEPANLAAFPAGIDDVCSPEQLAWLGEHGEPVQASYTVEIRNVASEGAMLSVSDIRGNGEAGAASDAVLVECNTTGFAGNGKAARLSLDSSVVAYFDNSIPGTDTEGFPDSPVVYNLAPGEVGQFTVRLESRSRFTGSISMTVTSGRERVAVPVTFDDGTTSVDYPGTNSPGGAYLTLRAGALVCALPGLAADSPQITEDCPLASLLQ